MTMTLRVPPPGGARQGSFSRAPSACWHDRPVVTNVVKDISHAQEVQRPRERRTVSFPELVRLRFVWRKRAAADGADPAEEAGAYHSALADFERDHGRIVNAYWCSAIEAAVALTEKPRTRGVLKRWHSPIRRFHRVSDYATRDEPEIARLLHQCDELAIRAIEVLGGSNERICMQLVMASSDTCSASSTGHRRPSTKCARRASPRPATSPAPSTTTARPPTARLSSCTSSGW